MQKMSDGNGQKKMTRLEEEVQRLVNEALDLHAYLSDFEHLDVSMYYRKRTVLCRVAGELKVAAIRLKAFCERTMDYRIVNKPGGASIKEIERNSTDLKKAQEAYEVAFAVVEAANNMVMASAKIS